MINLNESEKALSDNSWSVSFKKPYQYWLIGLFITYATLSYVWLFFIVTPSIPSNAINFRDIYQTAPPPSFLQSLNRFDAPDYISIAREGYRLGNPDIAFYPLYPFSMRLLSLALFHDLSDTHLNICGLAISLLAALCIIYALDRLCRFYMSPSARHFFLLLWMLNPTAVFLFVTYTESLFLALTIGGFLRMRRGDRIGAGALIGLACLTRPVGFLAYAAYLTEILISGKRDLSLKRMLTAATGVFLPAIAIIAFMIFQSMIFHDPFASIHAEQRNWNQHFLPFWEFPGYVADFIIGKYLAFPSHGIILFYSYILLLISILLNARIIMWRDLSIYLKIYSSLIILSIVCRSSEMSIARMLMAAFPLHMALADWGSRKPARGFLIILLFAVLDVFGTAAFIGNKFFF